MSHSHITLHFHFPFACTIEHLWQMSHNHKHPIATWSPLTTKPFPLPAKQEDSFKVRIPSQLILTHMVRFLPLTLASHCTRPYQLSITSPSSPYQKAHGYLATISSRNHFFTNKLAFPLPAINKAADWAALSYMQWNCKLLWGPKAEESHHLRNNNTLSSNKPTNNMLSSSHS